MSSDPTEPIRRELIEAINSEPCERARLEMKHGEGNVWSTDELGDHFVVHSFLAPFVYVTRITDGKKGLLVFQHDPRFYFDFQPESN